MIKEFNVTGTCIPTKHYMVDITDKLNQVIAMIDSGKYFTINRARQYGKTTMLSSIIRTLKDKYYVVKLSFEGVGDGFFSSEVVFCEGILEKIVNNLSRYDIDDFIIDAVTKDFNKGKPLDDLSKRITQLCSKLDREIIMLIDEVDKSSDNQIFLSFLGMLRNKYLDMADGLDVTFKSVILAGVYDIKNLKLRIRSSDEKKYNSPWNIATDFLVDMSFNPIEISSMLIDYERDYSTGMDIQSISNEIYKFTSGYPYLVSRICKIIHEELNKDWSLSGIKDAIKIMLDSKNTLFDDIIKNIYNNREFSDLVKIIILDGQRVPFNPYDRIIDLGVTFGILSKENTDSGNYTKISNKIFEMLLYNLYISEKLRLELRSKFVFERNQFIENGKLNMENVILKFQEFMKSEYYDTRQSFIEDEGRLLFLCFLKPIINGTGFYYVEPQTRNKTRMDIVVTYGREEYIIELKIWHGDKKHQEAYNQLLGYMDNRNQVTGYLVTFSFNLNKEYTYKWNDYPNGKRIFEVIV